VPIRKCEHAIPIGHHAANRAEMLTALHLRQHGIAATDKVAREDWRVSEAGSVCVALDFNDAGRSNSSVREIEIARHQLVGIFASSKVRRVGPFFDENQDTGP